MQRFSRSTISLARQFSTAVVDHTPPIKLFGINGRYASALYRSASKVKIYFIL